MNNFVFSIIIPTYNSGNTIVNALNSIYSQSFTQLEIIIIDGLSTDNTIEVVKTFAAKDNRIKWISEKDSGVYDAMNKGVDLADGQWLYFLGSDDTLYDTNVLHKVYNIINSDQDHFEILYGNVMSRALGTSYDGEFSRKKILEKNICHQAIFYKNTVFKEVGYYNVKYKIAADYEFNMRCFFNNRLKIKYADLIIAHYFDAGLSSRSYDALFYTEYPDLVRRIANQNLSLARLRAHSTTRIRFLSRALRKFFMPICLL